MRELRQSGEEVLVGLPADGNPYSAITFQRAEDIDGDGDAIDDATSTVEWGNPITYALGGLNGQQLLRTSAGASTVWANWLVGLQFRRLPASPHIVEITLQTQAQPVLGPTIQATLNSQATLRNSSN